MPRRADPDSKIFSACDAIPVAPAEAISANMIFNRQEKPRMPMREIEAMCEDIAARGDIEVVVTGYMRLYRWKEFDK